jgi:hypothetical protein
MNNRLFHISELLPHALRELADQAAVGAIHSDDRPARPLVATVGHALAFPRLAREATASSGIFKWS